MFYLAHTINTYYNNREATNNDFMGELKIGYKYKRIIWIF